MKIINIRVKISGLYEMGPGFLRYEDAVVWGKYFRDYKGNFWKAVVDDLGSTMLVGTHMGGLIHPMDGLDFSAVVPGYMEHNGMFKHEVNELRKILNTVVTSCGGTYEIAVKLFDVDTSVTRVLGF